MSDDNMTMNKVVEVLRHLSSDVEKLHQAVARSQQEYLSNAQVAELTGLSEKHIQRAIHSGKLPCSNVGGPNRPTLRIARADVEAWMQSTKIAIAPTGRVRRGVNGKGHLTIGSQMA